MGRLDRTAASISRGLGRVTGSVLGPYQSAVIRIGFSATWLLFLLRELPHRHELYGPDGPWNWDMARQLIDDNHAFTVLMWFDGRGWFECVYVLSMVASALLLLGWRTRTMSVLFMVGVLSLQNRSVFMGDGGDNVIHLMAIYLVLTRCGQVWSLDARRRARARGDQYASRARGDHDPSRARGDRFGPVLWVVLGVALIVFQLAGKVEWEWDASRPFDLLVGPLLLWGVWLGCGVHWLVQQYAREDEPRVLVDVLGNILHNAALFVIMAEACLIYATAGWYKIQGGRWQDGTAVYYPLHLDYFSPWPALSELLASSGLMLMLVTYGTVAVQVAFPFTLFNRRVKNVLLVAMITEHAVIAVVLGLPFFSLAMIAADAVFLPTSFLRRVGGWAERLRGRLVTGAKGRLPGPRQHPSEEHDTEAAEHARVGFTP
ncbi:HTTM domain-containing protein [Streptomyces sp. NBC_01304]|uniref:HTTM domain-containing protein n=1 Tax=Streptomyces sp. NBC_01304 TaxID=2903818 RepID=UPI002E13A6B6|nr:HTTM domain-containing protein [Streptomyces sp. NBC_01304]